MSATLMFDVWVEPVGRWIGMAEGETVQQARETLTANLPARDPATLLLTPFYGCNTSEQTYLAVTGRMPIPIPR